MIFSSYEFIFGFLPIVWIVYVLLNYFHKYTASKLWLIVASLFFYAFWNVKYVPLILLSMAVNYLIGRYLATGAERPFRKPMLILGIVFNLGALAYYKYYDFFIGNVNSLFGLDLPLLNLVLPLAISFFTFVQITFIVDAYKNKVKDVNLANFVLFVTYFPHLIAGPIVHHHQLMPQFANRLKSIHYENMAKGIFIFMVGLFKKTVLADSFAVWANAGYQNPEALTLLEGWGTSLAFTFQLYFDFSGYSDMAIGASLLFNITLPINFHSPLKATSIMDFWKRWHITLTRFLTEYVYIPLGGNRKGTTRTYINVFIIFFLSGLWHGAGWTFIIWGCLHGIASILNRLWNKGGFSMPNWLGWIITFQFVNFAFIFFRAESPQDAMHVINAMLGQNGVVLPEWMSSFVQLPGEAFAATLSIAETTGASLTELMILLISGFVISLFFKNSVELIEGMKPKWTNALWAALLFVVSLLFLSRISDFLYFNF